jgi:hypothetical protein
MAIARPAPRHEDAVAACGIALTADVSRILASEPLCARLSGQLADLLGRELPVSLLLTGLGDGEYAALEFETLCQALADALDTPGVHSTALEITLPGQTPDPAVAWRIRRDILGEGPLNIVCDEQCMSAKNFWLQLWALREEAHVRGAFWPLVASPCPLLMSEHANNILPESGLQAPSESAWVSASLRLTQYTDARGELDDEALVAALENVLLKAESVHVSGRWPTAAMQHDAWMNRRLAIRVDGLGDYAKRLGLQPGRHETLQKLRQVLLQIRHVLRQQSRQLAKTTGVLPAIDQHNPARKLTAGPDRDRWEMRWLRAVERSATAHRNLLVLSPWALFPRGSADLRWMDLLPLLRMADACVFRDRPDVTQWNINEFKHFHRRTWALMRQIEADALVAERL